jgi:hypothetical protein
MLFFISHGEVANNTTLFKAAIYHPEAPWNFGLTRVIADCWKYDIQVFIVTVGSIILQAAMTFVFYQPSEDGIKKEKRGSDGNNVRNR